MLQHRTLSYYAKVILAIFFCTGQQFSHTFISRTPGSGQSRCHKDSGYRSRLTPPVIPCSKNSASASLGSAISS